MSVRDMVRLELLADLKQQPVSENTVLFLTGITSLQDGRGGFYMWNPTSTASEDTAYYNTIASDLTPIGRWIRVFQRTRVLPHGILNINGGVKTFYAAATTDGNSQAKINLTMDNTANGESIFSEIWFNDSQATAGTTNAINAVKSYIVSADLKQTTHGFYRSQAINVVAGILAPVIGMGAGTAVRFKVEGL